MVTPAVAEVVAVAVVAVAVSVVVAVAVAEVEPMVAGVVKMAVITRPLYLDLHKQAKTLIACLVVA